MARKLPRIKRVRPNLAVAPVRPDQRVSLIEHDGVQWYNIENPSRADLADLWKQFKFHELDLEDVLSRRQRPKVDEYDDYLLVVLHFPIYDRVQERLSVAELDLFIGDKFLVTVPNRDLFPLEHLFGSCETSEERREELFEKGSSYLLYRLLADLYRYCFPILDKIGQKLDDIEDGIFEGGGKEMVRQISNVKQEIIAYRKIIKPGRTVLRILEKKVQQRYGADVELYFDDVIDAGERIWDILENYKEVVEALEDTNEAVIQHRLNDILLVLTMISVTLLPLTLLTGVYGMNVPIPLQQSAWTFPVLLLVMMAIAAGLVWIFKRQRWF